MSDPPRLTLYLTKPTQERMAQGSHGFLRALIAVVRRQGWQVAVADPTDDSWRMERPGYALFQMDGPRHPRALTYRRVYHYPFWKLEKTGRRWEWATTRRAFPADQVRRKQADRFHARWRARLFGPVEIGADGFIYMPLQGRLLTHRSFQTCSPLDMIRATLAQDPARRIIAGLHPKESYTEAEIRALERLEARHARLEIRHGGMAELLPRCDYVVTQNSAVAFDGYFLQKPAILFARVDFHHIAGSVPHLGVAGAFRQVAVRRADFAGPDFAGYVHWFWQQQAINAARDGAEARILAELRAHGWCP